MPAKKQSTRLADNAKAGVLTERAGDVLNFTLDNTAHENHVTGAMFDVMLATLHAESRQRAARVLRVRARGPVFCTGRERAGRNRSEIRRESERLIAFKRALRTSPMISVAEVQGDAFGFGFGLAIVCDFALVADNARLGFPEMRSGLAPTAIMAYLGEYTLPRWAFPLVLFGEATDPRHALQVGLISQVCAPDRLAAEVDALIGRILELDPEATRRCKEFFLSSQQRSFEQNCRMAADALTSGSLAVLAKAKATQP
jgi:methylglutaconyl-CoA hydratase